MTADNPPEDPEREAPTGGEERAGAANGRSGGRRRQWRTAAIGLGSAVGVAGIAVLSVFIYSIFDDDTGGWSTYDYSIGDDDSGGWFGYAPLPLDEDRGFDRDDQRRDGRDRPVEVPHHDEGAGDNGRPGDSAGHPDGTGGDKADGYEDAAAVAASKGCVEIKNLGRQVLLLCDRAFAGGKGVEGWWKGYGEPPGRDALDGGRPPAWGAEPRSRWRGPRWWPPDDGPPNPREFLGGFAFEDGYPEGDAGPSKFLEGWPAGPEMPFGVPGEDFEFGFDFEALIELLPYLLGGEMFEEFLGSILEGQLDGFEGLPEGDFDFDAPDELDPGELLEGLDVELLGLILEGLLAALEESPGADVDLDPEGFGDTAPDVLSEEWFEELFGSLLEDSDVEA